MAVIVEQFPHRCREDFRKKRDVVLQKMLRMLWMESVSTEEVLSQTKTKRTLRIKKRRWKCLWLMVRKTGLGELDTDKA